MGWEPPWKSLVDQLEAEEFDSPYLDRLRERYESVTSRHTLERELIEEMAYALGRAEDKVNVALLRLDVLDRERAQATEPAERAELAQRFNAQRREAQRSIRDLMIHREALGLRRHEALSNLYPVPPAADETD